MKNGYEIRGEVTAIFLNRKNGDRLETLISTSDLAKAKNFSNTWCVIWRGSEEKSYVHGQMGMINGKSIKVRLHRWLLDAPKGFDVDHIDHNALNNTRDNLRIITHAQNKQNLRGAYSNSKSGIRGVSWHKGYQKWQANLNLNGKQMFFGYFEDKKDAEKIVLEARKKYMPYAN